MKVWTGILFLLLASCSHSQLREPSSQRPVQSLMPKSQSYSIGESPEGSGTCRILVSFDTRDVDACLFGFHSSANSKFTCYLQNPIVPLGTEGSLAEQNPTQFRFFKSKGESGRLQVFADHLEIVIVAADVSRAQQLLLSKVKQFAGVPRMVKYLVPADTCRLH